MPSNDSEFNAACWEAGVRPEWDDPAASGTFRLHYAGGSWTRQCGSHVKWFWHGGLTDHEAACLFLAEVERRVETVGPYTVRSPRCPTDEGLDANHDGWVVCVMNPDDPQDPLAYVRGESKRDALLAAWKEVQGK